MNDELLVAIAAMTDRLARLAAEDDGLRDDLRALALAVLAATDRPSVAGPEPGPEPELSSVVVEESSGPFPAVLEPDQPADPLRELTFGRPAPTVDWARFEPPAPSHVRTSTEDADLPAIETRCRLKAEGARWAATRRRWIDDGADFRLEVDPRDREILDRARELDCYLWMNGPDFAAPREPAKLEDLAGCFETTAEALALARSMAADIPANREFFEPALDLLAEAQSALRVAVERVYAKPDNDQFAAYDWLRGVTERERIYVARYMRLNDPADPAILPVLDRKIDALDSRFQEVRGRAKKKKKLLSRLRFHAKQIAEGTEDMYNWRKVAATVDEMVADGVPASNLEIREVLLPILGEMPDIGELPPGYGLALREIDRYQAGRPEPREAEAPEPPTAEVSEAARLLRGKAAMLIGGCPRTGAREAIEAAFGLDRLIWFETREHESIEKFAPSVARPEVAVVLLAIRWSSHSFGDVKRFCDRHGKPMVRLPRGYSPNQVAVEVVSQVSGQLEANHA